MNGGTAIEGDKPQMMEQKERRDCRRGGRTVSDRKRRAAGLLAGLPALCMELLFPARCPFCDAVLGFSGPCAACEEKLRTARRAPAAPVPAQGHEMRFMDAVYAPYFYESMVQNAILRMKFHGRPDLARPLAGRMAGALREAAPFARAELIVPVPSGRRELRRRGYDVRFAKRARQRRRQRFREKRAAATCTARLPCTGRLRWRAGISYWWTTYTPRAPRWTHAPAR